MSRKPDREQVQLEVAMRVYAALHSNPETAPEHTLAADARRATERAMWAADSFCRVYFDEPWPE